MHECRCSDPIFLLELLFGEEDGRKMAEWLRQRLKGFSPPAAPAPLDQKDALLVTSVDQFYSPGFPSLQTLRDVAAHLLRENVTGLHLTASLETGERAENQAEQHSIALDDSSREEFSWLGREYLLMLDVPAYHFDEQNPQNLQKAVENLLFPVENCVKLLCIKDISLQGEKTIPPSSDAMMSQLVVNFYNALLASVAPGVLLVCDKKGTHSEIISCFGNGYNAAHLVTDHSLSPLLLHAIQQGDAGLLSEWVGALRLPSTRVSFYNTLPYRVETDLRPLQGILNEAAIRLMQAQLQGLGQEADSQGGQGTAYFDVLAGAGGGLPITRQVQRLLASLAIQLALVGLPGIDARNLFWQPGSTPGERFDRQVLTTRLADAHNPAARVYHDTCRLLRARASCPAFHPHGAQLVLPMQNAVFSLLRISADGMQAALCLHNLSSEEQHVEAGKSGQSGQLGAGTWCDLFSGNLLNLSQDRLVLRGYQVLWLVPQGQ